VLFNFFVISIEQGVGWCRREREIFSKRQEVHVAYRLVNPSALGLPRSFAAEGCYFWLDPKVTKKSSQADRCHFTGQTPGRAP